MKKMLQLTLVLFLFGCGGGDGGGNSNSGNDTKPHTPDPHNNLQSTNTKENQNTDQKTLREKGIVKTSGPAKSVAVTDEALFVAEGKHGVEIMKIGFSDQISSELIAKIPDINAKHLTLSEDGNTLMVEQMDSRIAIVDIRDLSHPKKIGIKPKNQMPSQITTQDGQYRFVPKGKDGMVVIDISNPSNPQSVGKLKSSQCFDLALIRNDRYALIATGSVGIKLLDLKNPRLPNPVADYRIPGSSAMGLSISPDKSMLFVATGTKGVMIFNLDMLLQKMGY